MRKHSIGSRGAGERNLYSAVGPNGILANPPKEKVTLMRPVEELLQQYPWFDIPRLPEVYQDRFRLGEMDLEVVGLTYQVDGFGEVTGSAVGIPGNVFVRAWFELLERITLVKSEINKASFRAYDENENFVGLLPARSVFPTSDQAHLWEYSKSNGVAAHLSFETAKEAACRELIERDRILRSWYGEIPPKEEPIPSHAFIPELTQTHEMEFYSFGEGVTGVFGFPKGLNHPLLMGFGSNLDLKLSMDHAVGEAVQRLVFLWGEGVAEKKVPFSPTVNCHLDTYSDPQRVQSLRQWLTGTRQSADVEAIEVLNTTPADQWLLVDLTPPNPTSPFQVLKALSAKRLPLTFGYGNPRVRLLDHTWSQSALGIHPIA